VMVKIPGTSAGLPILRELSRRGIPTNCTSAYTVPQFIAVAENVQAGILEARAAGVDLTSWKSVVTDMSARWENAPAFEAQAKDLGVSLSPEDRRWAGVAVFKHAQRVFRQRAYPSKMLICSVRVGPNVDGVERCWHLEHTAGADAVFTLPPAFLTEFIQKCGSMEFGPRIWDDIPADVMARLRRLPYFNEGYDVDGSTVADFDSMPALQITYREFSKATEDMVSFVRERMA
jgi:transaldolase